MQRQPRRGAGALAERVAVQRGLDQVARRVDVDVLLGPAADARERMVLQVAADAGQVGDDRDAQRAKVRRPGRCPTASAAAATRARRRTAAPRAARAAGAACRLGGSARHGPRGLDQQPGHLRLVSDRAGWAAARRRQECLGGAEAFAVPVRDLVEPDAILVGAVEVGVERVAGLRVPPRRTPGRSGSALRRSVTSSGPPRRGRRRRRAPFCSGLLEVRQQVVEAPARVAERRPMVVVVAIARGCRPSR